MYDISLQHPVGYDKLLSLKCKHTTFVQSIVVRVVDGLSHAKVTNLHHLAGIQQTVATGQVSVTCARSDNAASGGQYPPVRPLTHLTGPQTLF